MPCSAQGVAKAVLSIIDHFVAMMNTIPRIESELGKGAGDGRANSSVAWHRTASWRVLVARGASGCATLC
jgi:hypothetical protein